MTKERNVFEILSVLDRKNRPMTSREITEELNDIGIPLTGRMVRNYLQRLDKKGFTENLGKKGRRITEEGRDELRTSFVYARSDFILDKIARMITDAKFDVNKQRGEVIVNLSFIEESQEQKVRGILEELCQSSLFPQLIKISYSGEKLCNKEIPEGMVGLVTISSATIDQILLNYGIYTNFGCGLTLKLENKKPVKCTNIILPTGCSIDSIELFMLAGLTSINNAISKNNGDSLAEYIDVPYTARTKVITLLRKATNIFGGTIIVGRSMDKTLDIPTRQGYIGIITLCGESLPAALEERGIKTNTETVASVINFKELEPIAPVKGEVLLL